MRKKTILTLLFVLAVASVCEAAELTLEDCVNTAIKNHPDLVAAEAKVKSSKSTISQARAAVQPSLSASSSYSRRESFNTDAIVVGNNGDGTYNTGLKLSQLITDSGKTKLRIQKAQQTTEAVTQDMAEKRNEVIKNVSDAYYNVNNTERVHAVAKQRYENYEKRLKWASAYYKAGKKAKIEVTRAEADLASSKLALITAKTDEDVAKATLASAMGDAKLKITSVKDELEYGEWAISEDEAIKLALKNRPELIARHKRVEAAKTELGIQQKGLSPSISAGAGLATGGSSFTEKNDWNATVSLSLPILDGGATNSKIAQARADLAAAQAEEHALENSVILEVRKAWQNMTKANESIVSAREAERKEKENYTLAEKRYEAGVGSSLEISDAVDSYALAQSKTITALYNGKGSQLALLKAIGGRK